MTRPLFRKIPMSVATWNVTVYPELFTFPLPPGETQWEGTVLGRKTRISDRWEGSRCHRTIIDLAEIVNMKISGTINTPPRSDSD